MKTIQLVKSAAFESPPNGEILASYDSDAIPAKDDTITIDNKLYQVRTRNFDAHTNRVVVGVVERTGDHVKLFFKTQKEQESFQKEVSDYLSMKTVDINFLEKQDHDQVVEYLNIKYPMDKFRVVYLYSPFKMGYATNFCIGKIIFEDNYPTEITEIFTTVNEKMIYEELSVAFPHLAFDEMFEVRKIEIFDFDYPQYFKLENFLRTIGYDFPKDKVCRYAINPFTKEKYYYPYTTNGEAIKQPKPEKAIAIDTLPTNPVDPERNTGLYDAFYNNEENVN